MLNHDYSDTVQLILYADTISRYIPVNVDCIAPYMKLRIYRNITLEQSFSAHKLLARS